MVPTYKKLLEMIEALPVKMQGQLSCEHYGEYACAYPQFKTIKERWIAEGILKAKGLEINFGYGENSSTACVKVRRAKWMWNGLPN